MDPRPSARVRQRRVWFSPYLLAVALTPALLQTSTSLSCGPRTGDARLSELAVIVDGENQIAFETSKLTYEAALPPADDALIRAFPMDPNARVSVYVNTDSGQFLLMTNVVGGGEVTMPLESGLSKLSVQVTAPGRAVRYYTVNIQVGSLFACTEQGILDAIAEGGGIHRFACAGPTTVTTQAEIIIDNDVMLDGEGNLTINGNDDHRVLSVEPGVTVELVGMTVSGGVSQPGDQGAGLLNEGTLTMTNSLITDNPESYDNTEAEGIYNSGTLTLLNSAVSGNGSYVSAIGNTGSLTLNGSLVSQNSDLYQGTIWNFGTMTLSNTALVDNCSGESGIIVNYGNATVINTTVSHNCDGGVPLISLRSGTMTLIHSTVADLRWNAIDVTAPANLVVANSLIEGRNADPIPTCDLSGTVTSLGGNIESQTNDCGLTHPTDLVNVSAEDLKLGPLADNGGPTMTHALLPGSVAIDRIPEAMCVDADGQPLTTDQRGVARPQGPACDVGAFEWADCSGTACDDGNECTADHCDPANYAWCAHTNLPDGTLCGTDRVCEAGACRERSWGTPVLIGPATDDELQDVGIRPRVTMDPNGNVVVAVWYQSDGVRTNIWSNRYTPAHGWTTAELIEAEDAGDARFPEVAMDPNGNAVAVWMQDDGVRENIWSNRYTPEGGWGIASVIEADEGTAGIPEVAMDPNGNAVAVWDQPDGVRENIWSNRYTPEGGWGIASVIEADEGTAVNPDVAMDPNGNAVAVWTQFDGSQDRTNVWANRYTPSGGWGTAELIENESTFPNVVRVATDPSGNAIAICQSWANRYTPTGGWGTPEKFLAENAIVSVPQIAMDADGNAVTVWHQHDGTRFRIWSNRYTPIGGWETPKIIETDDPGNAQFPRLAMDPNGNAVAVWWQQNLANTNVVTWANHYTPADGWGTAELLFSHHSVSPAVTMDAAGSAVAVFEAHEAGSKGIWSNRFE